MSKKVELINEMVQARLNGGQKIVMGIDPGSHLMGYGFVGAAPGRDPSNVAHGTIQCSTDYFPERMAIIFDDCKQLIKTFKPCALGIERNFIAKNPVMTINILQCRAMAVLAAQHSGIPVYEYYPTSIKAYISHGKAIKAEMQQAIKDLLTLEYIPKPDDAADALCIAYYTFMNNII